MVVQPYLNFDGRCEEALEFYQQAVGAKVDMLMRFGESPEPCPEGMIPPGSENKVMHCSFRIGDSVVMASDCYASGKPAFQGISLSISTKSEEEAERLYAALVAGGKECMPLAKTFFSPKFGTLTDKFGVEWMIAAMVE